MDKPEGEFGMPVNTRRFHIFRGMLSLCGKWAYAGQKQPIEVVPIVATKEDCKECVRRYNAEIKG